MASDARPPINEELLPFLEANPQLTATLTLDAIIAMRGTAPDPAVVQLLEETGIEMSRHAVTSYDGQTITVHTFRRPGHTDSSVPAVYSIHGGGMVGGNSLSGLEQRLRWVHEFDVVLATVDYRLAPEHPDPTPVEDAYAGLVWFAESAGELGFDAERILIAGGSAGGGLAAGTTLLARDRRGPLPAGQILICPMLDDRDVTISSSQMTDGVPWDRSSNHIGWTALLGDRRGTDEVSVYAAPARATDLSGLPPTFIDVGSAEVFRDEAVEYAMKLWAAGGDAELHVWPGGFHGFAQVKTAAVAGESIAAVDQWLERWLRRRSR